MEQILAAVNPGPKNTGDETNTIIDRIVTSASNPSMIGNVNIGLENLNEYKPIVAADLVQMVELYVFDDDLEDYRIVTLAGGDESVLVFDRPLAQMFVEGEQPLIQVCPTPMHGYFWGQCEMDRLIPLQRMRNKRQEQVDHLMELQARPPKFGCL